MQRSAEERGKVYKGVVPQKNSKWGAQIYKNKHRIWLGTFGSEDKAALAVDRAAYKLRGAKSTLNLSTVLDNKTESQVLDAHTEEEVIQMIKQKRYDQILDQSRPSMSDANSSRKREDYDRYHYGNDSDRYHYGNDSDRQDHYGSNCNCHNGGCNCYHSDNYHSSSYHNDNYHNGSYYSGNNNTSIKFKTNVHDDDEDDKVLLFEKALTPSDVGKLNRLVIPKLQAEAHFPLHHDMLYFEDFQGNSWQFRYSYWHSSQSYVLTKGWSRFIKSKTLNVGDLVCFYKNSNSKLFLGFKKTPPPSDFGASALLNPFSSPPDSPKCFRLFGFDIRI